MVGTLGWLVVVPALGTFVGRTLDRMTGMGVTFVTGAEAMEQRMP